jgi:hypothetical protein
VNDKVIKKRDNVPLRQLADVLFLGLPGREQGMFSLRPIIPAHAFERLFGPVDFPADVERVEIDGDGIIQKRE